MGIKIVWDNEEKTIIRYVYDAKWTWDDFFKAKTESYNQIDTVSHKVGVIMDTPPDVAIPPGLLTHGRSALGHTHDNTAIIVVIIQNRFVQVMISTLVKVSVLAARRVQTAKNLDEAREIIEKRLSEINRAD